MAAKLRAKNCRKIVKSYDFFADIWKFLERISTYLTKTCTTYSHRLRRPICLQFNLLPCSQGWVGSPIKDRPIPKIHLKLISCRDLQSYLVGSLKRPDRRTRPVRANRSRSRPLAGTFGCSAKPLSTHACSARSLGLVVLGLVVHYRPSDRALQDRATEHNKRVCWAA